MHMYHVNYYALIAAAAIQWVIGAIWYGMIFKKSWKSLVGDAGQIPPGRTVFTMICSYVASLVLCYVLGSLIMLSGTVAFMGGLALGVVCWLGFMAPQLFAQHIFERRPVNLFAINAGYWVVAMAISGGVLAVWR